jgi:hypothetical protein
VILETDMKYLGMALHIWIAVVAQQLSDVLVLRPHTVMQEWTYAGVASFVDGM